MLRLSVLRPLAVINAAAYTDVDKAEDEEETATLINGTAPGAMSNACFDLGIPFVQISTDYVFNGKILNGRHMINQIHRMLMVEANLKVNKQ